MVDERRVRRLLQRVSDDLGYLASRAGGDRNLLVADPDRLAFLDHVGDLDAFVASVATWMTSPPPAA